MIDDRNTKTLHHRIFEKQVDGIIDAATSSLNLN
jgi:hypothetical protein